MKCSRWKVVTILFVMLFAVISLSGCKEEKPVGTIRIGSLKGPTSLGLLAMMHSEEVTNGNVYEFQMAVSAEELLPLMAKGELDIALLPANAAANLYAKTEGGIAVIDINTLGVLYLVTGDKEVRSLQDLENRTVYLTGKGTTPEASLRYLLQEYGVSGCTLEFKSEPTEVAAALAACPDGVGLLPQPYVTAALTQNPDLCVVVDLDDVWCATEGGSGGMVTGVTVVNRTFLDQFPDAVEQFLSDHNESVRSVNADPKQSAAWAVEAGIVAKEAIAVSAIPECNLVCITGDEMRDALSAYLQVLADFDSKLIGGKMPGEDFYAELQEKRER